MLGVGLCSLIGAARAQPLFSQTHTSGSFHTDAWIAASWKVPRADAPSPKNTAVTSSPPSSWVEIADPAPQTKVGADGPALPHHAALRIDEVHGPATLAAGAAAHAPEQVAEQRAELHPLREGITQTAVGVEEPVVWTQRRDGAGLEALLSDPGMPEAAEAVLGDVLLKAQFRGTCECHHRVEGGGQIG